MRFLNNNFIHFWSNDLKKKKNLFHKNRLPENKVIIANVTTIRQADINNLDKYHWSFQTSYWDFLKFEKYSWAHKTVQ